MHKVNLLNWSLAAKGERSVQDTEHLDFKVMVEPKESQAYTVILVASSRQEKSAWTSDISQVEIWRCNFSTRKTWGGKRLHIKDPKLIKIMKAGCLYGEQGCELTHTDVFFSYPSPTTTTTWQCIDNIRCNGLMMNAFEENSKVTVPQMIKWVVYKRRCTSHAQINRLTVRLKTKTELVPCRSTQPFYRSSVYIF